MKLKDLFAVYNDEITKHKMVSLLGLKFDLKRYFKQDGKILQYDFPNHIEGRYIYKAEEANDILSKFIIAEKPCMIARMGGTELNIVKYFYDRKDEVLQVHYPEALIEEARLLPGIFSSDNDTLIRFSSEVLSYLRDIDVLLVWNCFRSPQYYTTKAHFLREYANPRITLTNTEPITFGMFRNNSWTKHLKGKKVLVISPFTETIKKQYENRKLLFEDKDILPDFDLKLIKSPQGIGKNNLKEEYGTWFNALESMKQQMNNTDFDICLVGAGAYGYHLAHHAKGIGKIGIHVAGALQLLFGIKGSRWTNASKSNISINGSTQGGIDHLLNEYWVYPAENEVPKATEKFVQMEGEKAYW